MLGLERLITRGVWREGRGRAGLTLFQVLLRLDLLNFVARTKDLAIVVLVEEVNARDKLPCQLDAKQCQLRLCSQTMLDGERLGRYCTWSTESCNCVSLSPMLLVRSTQS